MVIDEAQNLTPLEARPSSRAVGHGTRSIFTGDPYQIDNSYVIVLERIQLHRQPFPRQPIAAHIELQKGERSNWRSWRRYFVE